MMVAQFFLVAKFLPETKGVSLEDVAKATQPGRVRLPLAATP